MQKDTTPENTPDGGLSSTGLLAVALEGCGKPLFYDDDDWVCGSTNRAGSLQYCDQCDPKNGIEYISGEEALSLPVSSPCSMVAEVGYLKWHSTAERLSKKGQKQLQCATCSRWLWKYERDQCQNFKSANTELSGGDRERGNNSPENTP